MITDFDSQSSSDERCPFCQIIRGEVPAYIVFEDEVSLAFLDRRPLFPGHCLLVPKAHHPTLLDLPADLIGPLFTNAQRLARAVEQGLTAEGTFVALNNRISQSVPHLHIHIVPRRKKDGLKGFFWPRQRYQSETAMLEIQQKLRSVLAGTRSSQD
jgi:histidine triad (HIT) family protein